MTTPDLPSPPRPLVMTLQLLWFAMLAGVTAFAAIVVFVLKGKPVAAPIISYVAVGFSALAMVASIIAPAIVGNQLASQALAELDSKQEREQLANRLVAAFQNRLIVGLAILEGAACFSLVAFQLERQPFVLAATAALWLLLLVRIPTQSRVESWCLSVYENNAMIRL
jgi:hypothetical protein